MNGKTAKAIRRKAANNVVPDPKLLKKEAKRLKKIFKKEEKRHI